MILPLDHPRRQEFNDEVHARPPETLQAPLRLSYLALFAEGTQRQQGWDCAGALTARALSDLDLWSRGLPLSDEANAALVPAVAPEEAQGIADQVAAAFSKTDPR